MHPQLSATNNNNEYLECLTHTGPKHLHVLYKYILSKFNTYNMHTRAHTRMHTHTDSHMCTQTHTLVAYQGNQGNETEEKVFKKRNVFKEDLKELTEVEWHYTGVSLYVLLFLESDIVQTACN